MLVLHQSATLFCIFYLLQVRSPVLQQSSSIMANQYRR